MVSNSSRFSLIILKTSSLVLLAVHGILSICVCIYLYVRAVNEGNDGVWREYKQMRNYVVAQIKLEKEQYYKQVIDNNKNNPREMWKKLKLLLPGKQTSAPETINFEGQIISDHLSIAQSFNNYFLESIDVIISNIPDSALMGELPVAAPCVAEKFDRFKSLSMTDLKRILNDLKDVAGGRVESPNVFCVMFVVWLLIGFWML